MHLNARDCFPGVEIKGGVNYFLWDSSHDGMCCIYTHSKNDVKVQPPRYLKEDGAGSFIRYADGVSIYRKVFAFREDTMDKFVSTQKPFDLKTSVHGNKEPFEGSIKLYERGGIGYVRRSTITKNVEWIAPPKVFISAGYNGGDNYPHQIIGSPIVSDGNSCCTETYLLIGPFKSKEEASNVASYIKTKFFRTLVMLKKISQHAQAIAYSFVPIQDFTKAWTDEELYAKYGLSDEEIAFIDSMIKPMK